VVIKLSVTRSVIWLCYVNSEEAKETFSKLKQAALAGPGEIQLRYNAHVPFGWWVVLYDIVWPSSSDAIAEALDIPIRMSQDSWFEYEGAPKIRQNSEASQLLERHVIEASEHNFLAFQQLLRDHSLERDIYASPRPSDIVRCGAEVHRRLDLLRKNKVLPYAPLALYP
jgi:hypothetical protein